MAEDKDKFLGGMGKGDSFEEGSLFSPFKEKKAPASPPPAPSKPPPVPQPVESAAKPPPAAPAPVQPAPAQPAAPGLDREMFNFLKQKISEFEDKLRESQEKNLAFTSELKGREEARRESRREMDEFMAELKRQQALPGAGPGAALELEKSKLRIEALEQKISELSARQAEPPRQQGLQREELDRLLAELKAGLGAVFAAGTEALKKELAEDSAAKAEELSRRINSEVVSAVDARLEAERAAREKEFGDLAAGFAAAAEKEAASREAHAEESRKLAASVSARADMLESAFASAIAGMKESMADLSAELKRAGERSAVDSASARSAVADAVAKISSMEISFRAELAALTAACSGMNAGLDVLRETVDKAAPDTAAIAKEILGFLETRGRSEADTAAAGALDFGYLSGSLENLEKAFFSASDTLRRAEVELRDSVGLNARDSGQLASRQAAILAAASREMLVAISIFRSMKAETLKPLRARLAP